MDVGQEQVIHQNAQQQPYFPPQSPIDEVTLVSQTNPHSLLVELQHKLRSEIAIEDQYGNKMWERPPEIKPMLNERGVHSILIDAYSVVNQNTILSNLSEEDVSKIVIELGKSVTFKLAMNWKEFECEKSNLSTIVLTVSTMAYTALRRGFEQGERTFLKTAVRTTETIMQRPQEAKQDKGF